MSKAKKLPYYKMYPADAETDENFRLMNDTEKGFYWRCLNHCWINGSLPADSEERARILGVAKQYGDKMWLRVGKCFTATEDGRVVNPRQEKERSEARAKSEKCTEAVRTRYERSNGRSTDELLRALTRPESDYESESVASGTQTTNPEKTSPRTQDPFSASGWQDSEDFERWWSKLVLKHPNRNRNAVAKTKAIELILQGVLNREAWEQGYERLTEAEGDSWQGGFAPNLWQMLDDRAWLLPPRPTAKRELTMAERIALA